MKDLLIAEIREFLSRANREGNLIPPELVEEFGERAKEALNKQFNNEPRDKRKVSISSIGRPLCQLQMQKQGESGDALGYNHSMKMLIGDLIEAAAYAIMKAAGVNIQETDVHVSLDINGEKLNGTLDCTIDGGVYDVKSASPYAFDSKFSDNGELSFNNDDFGYIAQGHGYGKARGLPFRGWIAVNKATGEWAIQDSSTDDETRDEALKLIEANFIALQSDAPFKRCFEDEPETHYKKETGNRLLGNTCQWCEFNAQCWPGLTIRPSVVSGAKNPPMRYYTHIAPEYLEKKDNVQS